MQYVVITSLVLAILANVALGLIVLQRAGDKTYGWLFAATVFGVAAWAAGDLIMLKAQSPDLIDFGAKLFYIAPMITPITIMLFSYAFPNNKKIRSVVWLICGLPLTVWVGLLLKDLHIIIYGVTRSLDLNVPVANPRWFILYAAYFSVFFMIAYVILFWKLRRQRGSSRTRTAYTFYGLVIGSMLAMMTNLTLPLMGIGDYVWLGPIGTFVFAVMVALAMIKHRLFDIHFFVVRATAYSMTTIVMSLLYIAPILYVVGTVVFGTHFTVGNFVVTLVIMSVAAMYYERIRHWFNASTNKIFFRDRYNPEELIAELNRVVVGVLDVKVILTEASRVLMKNLNADSLFVVNETSSSPRRVIGMHKRTAMDDDIAKVRAQIFGFDMKIIVADQLSPGYSHLKNVLQANDVALLARITASLNSGQGDLGYIAFGQKRGGNPYDSQDIRTLETVINGLVVAIQNATHFEEIQKFNLTLQQQVDARTKELQKSNAKLIALDESKDDFISMASHQLRTPLTAVKGYLSMVLDGDAGKVSPQQRKMLNQAFISSQRMVFLIADLLNVSRLKTGKFVIEPLPVNLAKLIDQEIGQLRETAAGRGVELAFDRPKDFPRLMLDETKIRQVVMNFVDNAIHYTKPGGHIAVELSETPRAVELRVRDDGIGVPRIEQRHLFTKFYRAANARRERPDGTGLGLFMAKKVIIAQGGAVIFDSREHKGSVFGFTLPKEKLLVRDENETKAQDVNSADAPPRTVPEAVSSEPSILS